MTINSTVPVTGVAYVNIHLDYGVKGNFTDMSPIDGSVDRYDPAVNSTTAGYDARKDNTTQTGDFALLDCTPYTFTSVNGGTRSDTVYNRNVFKKVTGGFGRAHQSSDGKGFPGVLAKLIRNSTKAVVATSTTDLDGYYFLNYKHTGKAEKYTIWLGSVSTVIELKANGWAEATYDQTTRTWFIQVR